jgi:hypothetical protein
VPCAAGETCDTTNHECVGRACATDDDCDVCQTCNGTATKACAAPPAGSDAGVQCVLNGR